MSSPMEEAAPDHDRPVGGEGGLFEAAVYSQLRIIAQSYMNRERTGHTLTATALVHEAYLRLKGHPAGDGAGQEVGSPEYARFIRAAAEAMRRILIDHGRARASLKRGGPGPRSTKRIELESIRSVAELGREDQAEEIIAFDAAFERLEAHNARYAEVVRLRFYAGLTATEAAQVMGVSERTVQVDWTYARAWLARELKAMSRV